MKDYLQRFKNCPRITTILWILLFFSVSWFSYGFYWRMDLSNEGLLRLTDSSKKTLRELPQPVNLEAFFSNDVPDAAVQHVKMIKDFLMEYAAISRGKVRLRFLDPDSDANAKERANELGIRPSPIGALDARKQEIASVYFSVAISYENKIDTIPNILESRLLEYELTSKIYKMAHPNEKRVGFLSGDGPFTLSGSQPQQNPFYSLNLLRENIETLYGSIREIDARNSEITGDVSTLLLVQPNTLSEIERFRLDQFLMRGGNLIVAASGMNLNMQNGMASAASTDLGDFLKEYGVELGSNMILDPENYMSLPQRMGFEIVEIPYPLWVLPSKELLNSDNMFLSGIPALLFPYASTLKTDAKKLPTGKDTGFEILNLARSGPKSFLQQNFVMIDPMRVKDMITNENTAKENVGNHNLSILVKGKFRSAYAVKPLPPEAPKDFIKAALNASQMMIISSPYVLSDLGAQRSQGLNLNFLLTTIDIMNGMEDLVSLRKKQKTNPQVKNISYGLKQFLTFLNFLLPLAGIAGFGLMRYIKRSRQMNQVKESGTKKPTEAAEDLDTKKELQGDKNELA